MITEPDRAKVDRAMHAYLVFNFAYKVIVSGLGQRPTSEEAMRVWQLVEEIAKGETTLNYTAAELAQAAPPKTPAMREHYEQTTGQQVGKEREIAKDLVQAREGFHVPPKAG